MRRLKMKSGWILTVVTAVTLTACGSDPVENEDVLQDIDPPQQIEFIEEDEELDLEVMEGEDEEIGESVSDEDGDGIADEEVAGEEKGGPVSESVMSELYLMDSNGYVAPQSLNIPMGSNEVENTVEYLVKDGPVTELIPNGFQAVLPAGTEVLDVEVSSGVATVDLSDQFAEYHPEQELQVLQALTWSVTQFDDVDRLKLKMNGEELDMMPQSGTPISSGYTRSHGINLEMNDMTDITNTSSIVVYFLAQSDEETYYVPVTRRVPHDADVYEAVVGELLEGPDMMSPLLTDFANEVELLNEPKLAGGTLTLNFSEELLSMMEGSAVSEDVLNMLVLSLTEQTEVEEVALQVESEGSILVSSGETLTQPVTRPEMVNTGEY